MKKIKYLAILTSIAIGLVGCGKTTQEEVIQGSDDHNYKNYANDYDKLTDEGNKPKYEKYIDDAKQAETTEEKMYYLKKSLEEEYNTEALVEIRFILVGKIQLEEEYKKYYNMIKDSLKERDLNTMDMEIYEALADNELYYENYDKSMEYLKQAEELGMNLGSSHIFWQLKEKNDLERKHNSEYYNKTEGKKDIYLNKVIKINSECSELDYEGTDEQIENTYLVELKKWDNALNEIYNDLQNVLPTSDKEFLTIAQKDWIIRRDKAAKEYSEMHGNESTKAIEYNKSLVDSTRERYGELIEQYFYY